MSETINVRGPEYFREREREEYRRNSIKIVEAQAKEQFEKQMEEQVPEAIDKLLSGIFKNQKIDIQVKL